MGIRASRPSRSRPGALAKGAGRSGVRAAASVGIGGLLALGLLASGHEGGSHDGFSSARGDVDGAIVKLVARKSLEGYAYEEHCGAATCTAYFTRESTKRLQDVSIKRKDSTTALLVGAPALACTPAGGFAAAACGVAAQHKVGSMYDHLADAAQNGHCFAVRKPRWTKLGSVEAFYGSDYLVRTTPGRCLDA